MSKVSIFSSDYNKRRRKRKQKTVAAVIIFVMIILVIFFSSSLKSYVYNKYDYIRSSKFFSIVRRSNKTDKLTKVNDTVTSKETKTPEISSNNTAEKTIEVVLSNGTKIQAVYENKNGKNMFKYVTPIDAPVSSSINPSGTTMIVLENNTQSMFKISIEGSIHKINDTKYISSSGGILPKDAVLKSKPGYIWCSSPKFIDDNYVAYISQVPWFDKRTTKYVWIFNINNSNIKDRNDHTLYEKLGGDNVKFGNITSKGLEISIDNNIKYIKYNGKSIEISE
ncbi:hypothetical protein [Candidatus Clostridium stratigraminis]|uniref:Uncharacterized protein n=1 Tax=Candidatus Clostridium stratigraminis TaxID=3381661 RepID=A0ABW8T0E2_9CLOT